MNTNQINKSVRAAAIVINNQSVLLVYHKRPSGAYYVFPGGTVEQDENVADAALRELYEETSIKANVVNLLYHIKIIDDSKSKDEYFYQCKYISGTPRVNIGSIEWKRMESGTDFYQPTWVQVDDLKNLLVYPIEIRDWLIHDLNNGFGKTVKEETFMRSSLHQSL